ncbi:MAG: dipeptidase [Eubacteriales bacterium]
MKTQTEQTKKLTTKENRCRYKNLDLHCDSLTLAGETGGRMIGRVTPRSLSLGGYLGQVFAIYFPDPAGMEESDSEFFDRHIRLFRRLLLENTGTLAFADGYADLMRNRRQGRISALLSVEDCRILESEKLLSRRMEHLRSSGVRMLGLCWNRPNVLGYPASADPEIMNRPLTDLGMNALDEAADRRMAVDVSHLSDGGFRSVAERARTPFLASHSCCRAICKHPRNLSDPMLKTLGEHGGIAGVNFYPPFVDPDVRLMQNRILSMERVADHIVHMISEGGEDLPALGSDFDGFSDPSCPNAPEDLPDLAAVLQKRGLSERQIEKITCGNALRFYRELG